MRGHSTNVHATTFVTIVIIPEVFLKEGWDVGVEWRVGVGVGVGGER